MAAALLLATMLSFALKAAIVESAAEVEETEFRLLQAAKEAAAEIKAISFFITESI
jgi:hypothetical protein